MGGRVIKNESPWHAITIRGDQPETCLCVVSSGKRGSYLHVWFNRNGLRTVVTLSGPKTLSKLAHAILREIGEEPK